MSEVLNPIDSSLPASEFETFSAWLSGLKSANLLQTLDVEFALFIYKLSNSQAQTAPKQDLSIAVLAILLSRYVNLGHICLPVDQNIDKALYSNALTVNLASQLEVKVNTKRFSILEIHKQMLAQIKGIDWKQLACSHPLIAQGMFAAKPFCYQNNKLYMMRYWDNEEQVTQQIKRLAEPLNIPQATLQHHQQILDDLFARQYGFLLARKEKLLKALDNEAFTEQEVQDLVCDMLDVKAPESLDWQAIHECVSQAQSVKDLQVLDELVPDVACLNWQKVAAAVALSRRFAVISGGPGTGKTTTVSKLLAALVSESQHRAKQDLGDLFKDLKQGAQVNIKLCAPTGKAAARLSESITHAIDALPIAPEIKQGITTSASTLHKLLGMRPDTVACYFNGQNPLHLDVLVLDEASMVDLSLMRKLLDALPSHARLILLGDKDQLASVEAGAVLGDICDAYAQGYSQAHLDLVAKLTGFQSKVIKQALTTHAQKEAGNQVSAHSQVADSLCVLQKSYRFDARSGIGQLAKAINAGDTQMMSKVWQQGFDDIIHYDMPNVFSWSQMLSLMAQEYTPYCQALSDFKAKLEDGFDWSQAKKILEAFNQVGVLAALREGDFGVNGLNQNIEKRLRSQGALLGQADDLWYHGRPVMVSQNEPSLKLYNGDIGVCLEDHQGKLRVYFECEASDKHPFGIKAVLPTNMPAHATAFAMTVHKSQGSEFSHTLFVMPPKLSPILTRELIYTGVTRAKDKLSLFADLSILNQGIKIKTVRFSGLAEKLA